MTNVKIFDPNRYSQIGLQKPSNDYVPNYVQWKTPKGIVKIPIADFLATFSKDFVPEIRDLFTPATASLLFQSPDQCQIWHTLETEDWLREQIGEMVGLIVENVNNYAFHEAFPLDSGGEKIAEESVRTINELYKYTKEMLQYRPNQIDLREYVKNAILPPLPPLNEEKREALKDFEANLRGMVADLRAHVEFRDHTRT